MTGSFIHITTPVQVMRIPVMPLSQSEDVRVFLNKCRAMFPLLVQHLRYMVTLKKNMWIRPKPHLAERKVTRSMMVVDMDLGSLRVRWAREGGRELPPSLLFQGWVAPSEPLSQ
jgi:hypothetical protein